MLEWYGDKVMALVREAALQGLYEGGEHILKEAINLTPLDTGTLRRSGTVTVGGLPDADATYQQAKTTDVQSKPAPMGGQPEVYVSMNTPYAIDQHENLHYRHKDGQAKYLETAYLQEAGKVYEYAAKKIDEALRE